MSTFEFAPQRPTERGADLLWVHPATLEAVLAAHRPPQDDAADLESSSFTFGGDPGPLTESDVSRQAIADRTIRLLGTCAVNAKVRDRQLEKIPVLRKSKDDTSEFINPIYQGLVDRLGLRSIEDKDVIFAIGLLGNDLFSWTVEQSEESARYGLEPDRSENLLYMHCPDLTLKRGSHRS